ncbi:hypothetical protein [Parendozoicomonas haliclonae]|uniref:Uncharacterized protein n=1 Tax=Parendozoicomonas haliclonae TaxID=1960125 RepID=A0A1X7AJ88_9GAMM|nr:hypothetical protein [Parendozoicomonas haliclonae]SMA45470.1 hypothetical protein EHSB41UT_01927 [Parendozoicomonas haliclonae]
MNHVASGGVGSYDSDEDWVHFPGDEVGSDVAAEAFSRDVQEPPSFSEQLLKKTHLAIEDKTLSSALNEISVVQVRSIMKSMNFWLSDQEEFDAGVLAKVLSIDNKTIESDKNAGVLSSLSRMVKPKEYPVFGFLKQHLLQERSLLSTTAWHVLTKSYVQRLSNGLLGWIRMNLAQPLWDVDTVGDITSKIKVGSIAVSTQTPGEITICHKLRLIPKFRKRKKELYAGQHLQISCQLKLQPDRSRSDRLNLHCDSEVRLSSSLEVSAQSMPTIPKVNINEVDLWGDSDDEGL